MANLEDNPHVKLVALDITDAKSVFAAREKISTEEVASWTVYIIMLACDLLAWLSTTMRTKDKL